MRSIETGSSAAQCSRCGSSVEIPAAAESVVCARCLQSHAVFRSAAASGAQTVRLLPLAAEADEAAATAAPPAGRGSERLMALGFAGIVMAAAFLLGARALVLDLVLEPACTAACAEVGLEMAGMSSPGAGIRSSWKSPDTCSCRVGDRTQPPPTCRGDSTVSYDCDAGFWFGGGRWILSGLVNGLFLLGLASPFLIWGLVSLVQRRRRRAHHG